jgi:hypothetical protein
MLLALPAAIAAPLGDPDPDLLRFMNGDALHGQFEGLQEESIIEWSGSSLKTSVLLQTGKLRRVAFNGGRGTRSLTTSAYVHLPNGDRIPGEIVALDERSITIDSAVAGTLTVPRSNVSAIAPNPHGGAVHYIGPFSPDDWKVIDPSEEKEKGEEEDANEELNAQAPNQEDEAPEDGDEEDEKPWIYASGAWYSNSQLPIKVDAHIPDKARIAFRLAWRNRLNAVIAFHATTELPEPEEPDEADEDAEGEDGDDSEDPEPEKKAPKKPVRPMIQGRSSSGYPLIYGHSYVLTIYSNYTTLYRCGFDKDGNPKQTRLSSSSSNIRLEDAGEAEFELRCDRENNSITLFVDGKYVGQWEDLDGYVGSGSHMAFACQNNTSRIRVSNLAVTTWNGMIDSARSMDSAERDVILLTNGTDRFSGDLTTLEDGKFHLQGTYADMQIPIEQVQEIRFARKRLAELPAPSGKAVRLLFHPVGRLTVEPVEATRTTLEAQSPTLGDVKLDLRFASIIEFSFSDSILDSWDDDF